MRQLIGALLVMLASSVAAAADADCTGRDLIAALPAAERMALEAKAAAVPYSRGLLWQATRGDARIVLAGTYHFGDARLGPLVERLRPELARAATLLVEAGPGEQARLGREIAAQPGRLVLPEGSPPLSERLGARDWQLLSDAMAARGVPPAASARMQPWYLATMLSLSPCMLARSQTGGDEAGLDQRLIAAAGAAGKPVVALEPWDTVFGVFAGMSPQDEANMLRAALPQALHADDMAETLLNAYLAGDVWLIWEYGQADALDSGLTAEEVAAQTELTRARLLDRRNARWIAPLEAAADAAAAQGRPVLAAFGALHLPGENGVLRLLERNGWTVKPLPEAR